MDTQTQVNNDEKNKKKGVWKPFFIMIKQTKLPYIFIFLSFLFSIGGAQLGLMFPNATKNILAGDISKGAIIKMLTIMFSSAAVGGIGSLLTRVTSAKVSLSFRRFMIEKTLKLPVPYYDVNMADRLISRTTTDTTMMSDFIGDTIPGLPSSIYSIIGTIVILFSYDWRLVVLEAIMIPLVYLLVFFQGRVVYKWLDRIQGKIAELTGYLYEVLSNIPLVKVFVKEDKEEKRGQDNINALYKTKLEYTGKFLSLSFIQQMQSVIQTLLCVIGGIYLVSNKYITIDVWIAFYLYAQGLLRTLLGFGNTWQTIKRAQGAARRISEVATEQNESMGGNKELSLCQGDIILDNVCFKYSDDYILKNLSLRIPENKVTAIVGKSGAGKSTLFGLLEQFYTPVAGSLRLGDTDIKEFNTMDWRRNIGYVSQDTQMFSGTVRDNIIYGLDRKADEDEIIKAAKEAYAYDFIMSLGNGFDTEVGEGGSKLSGGQRQRIAIARAILKNPRILLLDEATSSLDAESEYMVEKAFYKLRSGRTTIVIAHRLTTIKDADQIIILDNKNVAGMGTHKELIEGSELYKNLVEMQHTANIL